MLLNNIIQLKSCIAFYSNYIDNDHPPNACVPVQLLQSCWTLRPQGLASQATLSMGFSRQEYWSGLSCPPPGDLPNPGIEPTFPVAPALQVDSFTAEPHRKPKHPPAAAKSLQSCPTPLLLLLLLSHFSRVRLCATPQTAAHQAPLSLGFSRQEHWSGLPFPSPMHESEK